MIWFDPFSDLTGASTIRLFDALQTAQDKAAQLRSATESHHSPIELTMALHQVGQLGLTLGLRQVAETALTEALALTQRPEIQRSLGWALRLTGQYPLARAAFEKVSQAANPESALAALGIAYCERDNGQWISVPDAIDAIMPQLKQEKTAHYAIMAHFIRAETFVRLDRASDAYGALDQLDVQLTKAKLAWFRPEWWALKSRLALGKGDVRAAEKSSRQGLGAVDDRGDGQLLPTLYRTLAAALERERTGSGFDDARDARHRSLVAAQNRGPQIEVARCLFELGMHYKLFASMSTRRARGSGYLYEADKLYQSMGIALPPTDGSTVPLL